VCYEAKHSPGYCFTYTEALEFTGCTSLDQNLLFHASSHALTGDGNGIGPRLLLYGHPLLPLGGQYLRLVYPDELKETGGQVRLYYMISKLIFVFC